MYKRNENVLVMVNLMQLPLQNELCMSIERIISWVFVVARNESWMKWMKCIKDWDEKKIIKKSHQMKLHMQVDLYIKHIFGCFAIRANVKKLFDSGSEK
jgi:hypothetical protein